MVTNVSLNTVTATIPMGMVSVCAMEAIGCTTKHPAYLTVLVSYLNVLGSDLGNYRSSRHTLSYL